jgi:hypothetical protein
MFRVSILYKNYQSLSLTLSYYQHEFKKLVRNLTLPELFRGAFSKEPENGFFWVLPSNANPACRRTILIPDIFIAIMFELRSFQIKFLNTGKGL